MAFPIFFNGGPWDGKTLQYTGWPPPKPAEKFKPKRFAVYLRRGSKDWEIDTYDFEGYAP